MSAGEIVDVLELILRAEQVQPRQHLAAVDGARVEIYLQHDCSSLRLKLLFDISTDVAKNLSVLLVYAELSARCVT